MSEPIQSISQGNYILATQQEVSHDNTLSGDGTTASPLGVVPGYNETVLYSGNLTANSTANLSESWKNFEYIKIYGYSTPGGSMFGEGRTEDMVSAVDTSYTPIVWNPDICLNTVASWNHRSNFNIIVSMPLTFTADTNVSAMNGRLMGYWNDSWQFSDAEQRCHCTKIVGINRK